MVRFLLIVLLNCGLIGNAVFQSVPVVQPKLDSLAKNLRLKEPDLQGGEYEVRIWNRQQLMYGDAQSLYLLRRTRQAITISKYVITWQGPKFKGARKIKPFRPATDSLWMKLVKQNILTLPDQIAIYDRLHPRPKKDSTWSVVEADGSINVKANRTAVGNVLIGDGEAYYVEILGYGEYRLYAYSNPKGYYKAEPTIPELQKLTTILTTIESFF